MTLSRVNDSSKKSPTSSGYIRTQLLRYQPLKININQLEKQLPSTVTSIYNEEQKTKIFIFNTTHTGPISAPTDEEVTNLLCYGTSEEPQKYSNEALLNSLC